MATDPLTQGIPSASLDGAPDTLRRYVDGIKADAPATNGTAFQFSTLVLACCTAFLRVGALYKKAATAFTRELDSTHVSAATEVLDRELVDAAKTKRGGSTASDLEAARYEMARKIGEALRGRVDDRLKTEAESVGQAVFDSVEALSKAIQAAQIKVRLPQSFAGGGASDLASLLRRSEARADVIAQVRRDPSAFLALYSALYDSDPAQAKELRSLARTVVDELADGSTKATGPRAGRGSEDVLAARRVQGLFKLHEDEDYPEEIRSAQALLLRLQLLTTRTVGVDWSLRGGRSASEFARARETGALFAGGMDPSWPVRFLPRMRLLDGLPQPSLQLPPWEPIRVV